MNGGTILGKYFKYRSHLSPSRNYSSFKRNILIFASHPFVPKFLAINNTSSSSIVTYRVFYSTKSKWWSVVGLEIHAQINTMSKLFSGSSTLFTSPTNNNVSLFDAAIPGTLPVLNKKCVEAGVLTALALSCRVNEVSTFDRKHYFYADLPAGFQITQQRAPLASDGKLTFQVFTPGVHKSPYPKTSKIKQIQLEQDSGKSLHDEIEQKSLIDLNRAGIPLMELVFEPDLKDGEEAAALVKELSLILLAINTCSCKMEEGALRVDANISICQKGGELGTRTEIKNIASIRGLAKAVDFEIERQIKILEQGGEIINETRTWDATRNVTLPMRDKEVRQDYRFMPEPNLLPIRLNVSSVRVKGLLNVEGLRQKIPELPEDTRQKLISNFGLHPNFAIILVNDKKLLEYFMFITTEKKSRDPKLVAKILLNEFLTLVNKNLVVLGEGLLSASVMGKIIDLLQCGDINLSIARTLMEEITKGNDDEPTLIVEKRNLKQITDELILSEFCREVIKSNPKMVKQYLSGKQKVFTAIVGCISDISKNKANFAITTRILKNMLDDMKQDVKNCNKGKNTDG